MSGTDMRVPGHSGAERSAWDKRTAVAPLDSGEIWKGALN